MAYVLDRNAYPLISRLHGLKLLVDDAIVTGFDQGTFEPAEGIKDEAEKAISQKQQRLRHLWRTCRHLAELLQLEDLYDASWHFTPLQIGSTLAAWTLQDAELLDEAEQLQEEQPKTCPDRLLPRLEHLRQTARRELEQSQEMYTMRSSYYRSIGRLFYLYDDFNDLKIHYNHSIQMAAAELTAGLIKLLDHRIDGVKEDTEGPLPPRRSGKSRRKRRPRAKWRLRTRWTPRARKTPRSPRRKRPPRAWTRTLEDNSVN